MIVKLQRPLSHPDGAILAYDQYRRTEAMLEQTPEIRALFGAKFKIFAEANKTPDGSLDVIRVVPDRGW